MSIFKALNIDKNYAGHVALDNVTIEVSEGSIYGLLGPNGAGKTTLLRIINQITAPDKGELLLYNRKLSRNDINSIGYMPEERGLYKKMRVGEHALYLAQLKGLSKADASKKLNYWFEKFEIKSWWNRKIEELSKGMQQKIQFIITIVHEPKLLIFDEPFTGFDPINANLLKKEILELKEKGVTIIFSTHNMESVEELCDHITLIDKAKTILQGNIRDIKKRFSTNTYLVGLEKNGNNTDDFIKNNFEIIERRDEDAIALFTLKSGNHNKNELLQFLMQKFTISSFNEKIPSMNEIFIRVVKEAHEKSKK